MGSPLRQNTSVSRSILRMVRKDNLGHVIARRHCSITLISNEHRFGSVKADFPSRPFAMTPSKPYQGMKSLLPFPTTPRNLPNHPENRHSRERTLWFHSLLCKREGADHLLMCDTALSPHTRPVRVSVLHPPQHFYGGQCCSSPGGEGA